jgi:hypothetical protein
LEGGIPLINSYYNYDFDWAGVLEEYGKPDEIYIVAETGPGEISPVSYELTIYYEKYGIFISFRGATPLIESKTISLCPISVEYANGGIRGRFIVPGTAEESYLVSLLDFDMTTDRLHNYDTDMTVDLFYETFIVKKQYRCFKIYPVTIL